jgi:magnesium chelatase subunit D
VDGLRADLVTASAAMAHAAWQGRQVVTTDDVRAAARLSLPHRRRRDPFDAPGLDEDLLERLLEETSGPDEPDEPDGPDGPDGPRDDGPAGGGPADGGPDGLGPGDGGSSGESAGHGSETSREDAGSRPQGVDGQAAGTAEAGPQAVDGPAGSRPAAPAGRPAGAAEPYRVPLLQVPGLGEGAAGRRSRARSAHGRVTGARRPRGRLHGLHLAATILAAAPHQRTRGRTGPGLLLRADDLREVVREGREGNLVLFVVDASGSMAARRRMTAVKTAVLSLLLDAYQRRDKVGLVTFRGAAAEVVLPPTSSVEAGAARLRSLPTGGRTPLAAGLAKAADVLRVERVRDPARRPLLVLVTDGRATAGGDVERAAGLLDGTASVVVDCESGPVRLGLAVRLAARLRARLLPLDALSDLGSAVRDYRKAV